MARRDQPVAVAVCRGDGQRGNDDQHVPGVPDRQPGGEEDGDGRAPGEERLARSEEREDHPDEDGDAGEVAERVLRDEPQLLERSQPVLAGGVEQDAQILELIEKERVESSSQRKRNG